MSNPFLSSEIKDIATAKLYEKAKIVNLMEVFGTNAPALTNGKDIYLNTEDNLYKTLPAYDKNMLKWLLWHEEQHLNLKHSDRFFRYLDELDSAKILDKFQVTKDEVNIIMDILVHDSLCNWFPELIETARKNYAQMRNCNSLKHTFKTSTLEEMLNEYKEVKGEQDTSGQGGGEPQPQDEQDEKEKKTDGVVAMRKDESKKGRKAAHKKSDETNDSDKPSEQDGEGSTTTPTQPEPRHDDVDWEKSKSIDNKEFITEQEAEAIEKTIEKIKRKRLKLAKITQTLNGLATSQRMRTYAMPSRIQMPGIILKGRQPGKAKLYLIFDASGSMSSDMDMFKEIIQKSIPQAMECNCEWFSGYAYGENAPKIKPLRYDKDYYGRVCDDYFKGKFRDFIHVSADSGYGDDGDRVIELCALAEEKGYSPIGVTDGGGTLRYPETLKKLKRTVLVGSQQWWLREVRQINPNVQTICTRD